MVKFTSKQIYIYEAEVHGQKVTVRRFEMPVLEVSDKEKNMVKQYLNDKRVSLKKRGDDDDNQ